MPDSKITALTSIGTSTDPANDPLVIVDVSDTSMAASGTTKKVSLNNLLACSPTATLASATITGDLTVASSILKVSGGNVGINTASPTNTAGYKTLEIVGTGVNTGGMIRMKSSDASVSSYDFIDNNGRGIFAVSNHNLRFGCNDIEQYRIQPLGIFTWYDGAGGTRMTLNSTGLGVGGSPSYKLSAIGTTNNQVILHVGNTAGSADGDTTNVVRFAAGSGANALWANARYDGFSHAWRCNSTTTQAMTLDASGNLLVGTTGVSAAFNTKFHLSSDSGTTRWAVGPYSSASNFVISAAGGGGVYLNGTAATSWTSASDERLKDIIEPINNAVAKVGSLRAVIGKFKNDALNTRKSFLIAQDIQAVLPEAVDASNPDRLGVAYTDVIPLLVAAIKELTARVEALEA
jgi:hypothetical protein